MSREDFRGIIGKMAALMRMNQGYSTVRKTDASHLTVGPSLKDRMSSLQTSEDALQRHRSTDAWEDIKQRGRPAPLPPKQADNMELVEESDVEASVDLGVAAALPRAHALPPDAAGGMTLEERLRRAQESFATGNGNRSGRRSPDEELSPRTVAVARSTNAAHRPAPKDRRPPRARSFRDRRSRSTDARPIGAGSLRPRMTRSCVR